MSDRLLIIEDEETLCESLKRVLTREGYAVEAVHTAESGMEALDSSVFDLIVTDIVLPGISGIEFLKRIKELHPLQIIIIMTAYASLETAVEALRAGAYDYIVKPVMHEEIKQIVRNALTQRALQRENFYLKKQLEFFQEPAALIGQSAFMKQFRNDLVDMAAGGSNLLIHGENGTGRKRIARVVHASSSRASEPFTILKCGELSDGPVEFPRTGTVFLDEISVLSPETQARLARVMRETEDSRLCCFIAATRLDAEGIRAGSLDQDMVRRLSGHVIVMPPLRDRREDIMPLADYFLQRFSREFGKSVSVLSQEVKELFMLYSWPGNIRELQNVLERAVLLTRANAIGLSDLPQSLPVS